MTTTAQRAYMPIQSGKTVLAVALVRLARGQPLTLRHDRLMPRFIPGRSVAPVRQRA